MIFSNYHCKNKEEYIKGLKEQQINRGKIELEILAEQYNIWITLYIPQYNVDSE